MHDHIASYTAVKAVEDQQKAERVAATKTKKAERATTLVSRLKAAEVVVCNNISNKNKTLVKHCRSLLSVLKEHATANKDKPLTKKITDMACLTGQDLVMAVEAFVKSRNPSN